MNNQLYLDLIKKVLIDLYRVDQTEYWPVKSNLSTKLLENTIYILKKKRVKLCHEKNYELSERIEGRDCPRYADTMIGLKRLENIEYCFNEIIKNKIPGDFIETGVWRGGATIFMKALLKSADINDRNVWVADSFEGLPKPDEKYTADKESTFHNWTELAVSLDCVKNNFNKYGLLDENVIFLKGWFKDTLPIAPINSVSLLRLDGDMYESTWDALINLYPKLSIGGYILIDDYNSVTNCKKAVDDYRKQNNITEEVQNADWASIFWKKLK
jgi:O-methyltransferase